MSYLDSHYLECLCAFWYFNFLPRNEKNMIIKFIRILLFVALFAGSGFAEVPDEKDLETMEKWTIGSEQDKSAPISSPVEISIDSVDGRIDSLTLEVTNTQPPSLLSNKSVSSGKKRAWLKNIGIVIRPTADFILWLPGSEKGDRDRKGAPSFTIEGDAKVYIDEGGEVIRTSLPMKIEVVPYGLGYRATVNYSGEKKVETGSLPANETALYTESGSNPVFTIRGVNNSYELSVRGKVDVKMSDYQKLYQGVWDVKK